ncbi:MAG: DUF5996 family protein [Chloroflexi bacterium]|nr:DUF5996 family protein [Chloroflexota bacterium]
MALPALSNWEATRDALHQIALVMGAVRVACSDRLPNDLHFSLDVINDGISTAELNCGGVLQFNVEDLQLTFTRGGRRVFTLDVAGHSQISLMTQFLDHLDDGGCSVQPSLKHIASDAPFAIDRVQALDYDSTLRAVFTALARFRAKLSGCVTPLVLWPHHFDLAFIWFATDGMDEHSDPQIAFGFAPFSPGLERPYFYAYAWSQPTGYLQLPLAAPAQALSEPYTGLYAPYDALRDAHHLDASVETMLMSYHRNAAERLSP